MKKIPTLYERIYDERGKVVNCTNKPTNPEFKKALKERRYIATVKFDGSCCAIFDGKLYKRYDAKRGKPVPDGAIKCQEEADPVTGHLPCWLKCDRNNPSDKWFWVAYDNACNELVNDYKVLHGDVDESELPKLVDGTYEAIGKHFNGNPYCFYEYDTLVKHGSKVIDCKSLYEYYKIKLFLSRNYIEGIVFYDKDTIEPVCKIKRSDFGFDWGKKDISMFKWGH